jgi:hypothetical protein
MRRFDGHGASSYRPTNPEAAKQQSSALRALLAERERQDAGLFGSAQESPVVAQAVTTQQITAVCAAAYNHKGVVLDQRVPEEASGPCYSLSDSNGK